MGKAHAPAPSAVETTQLVDRRHQRDQMRKLNLRVQLTYDGRTLVLARSQIGPADDRIARQQTQGMTVTGIFSAGIVAAQTGNVLPLGADMALVLWWMANRKSGDPRQANLSYPQVEAQFPSVDDVEDIEAEWIVDRPDVDDNGAEVDDPEA